MKSADYSSTLPRADCEKESQAISGGAGVPCLENRKRKEVHPPDSASVTSNSLLPTTVPAVTDVSMKRVSTVDTCSIEEEKNPDQDTTNSNTITDYAVHNGLKAGDRIQVLWDICNDEDDGDNNQDVQSCTVTTTTSHWWGATLQPWDGKLEDGMAIRSLLYDAFPPNFPEASQESVVFVERKDSLVSYPSLDPMIYRLENNDNARDGDKDENDIIVHAYSRDELEQLVDNILMGALAKHNAGWSTLSASHQANIAESIALKKAKLLELLDEHLKSHDLITADVMKAILARTADS